MRKIKLNINDKDYTLEMTRDTAKWLEAMGFSLEDFGGKMITYYDLLWCSLFLSNHKEVSPKLALKLRDSYLEKHSKAMLTKIIKFAVDEYTTFINALADTDSTETEEQLEIIED